MAKILPITKQMNFIDRKKFANMAFDKHNKFFVIYMTSLTLTLMLICQDQKAWITFLLTKKVTILEEYFNFANVFLKEKTLILSKQTKLNKHAIKLEVGIQPLYGLFYSLRRVELKTLKTYIETHLKTRFIWLSKSLADALILFDKKPNGSLWLYINYWDFNNLTIKNQYLLSFISKFLD